MVEQLNLNNYKKRIADLYNRRSQTYDDSNWHWQICRRLLEYSQVSYGHQILDIGTGTGHIVLEASRIVGNSGRVIGIDISAGMLEKARDKAEALGLGNVEFQMADAELLNFPVNSFDRILCANTFPWIENKARTLRLWHHFLKPDGLIGIHTPANTAYVGYIVFREVLAKYGIEREPSNRLGTFEACRHLFLNTGFEEIEIRTEQHGSYMSLEKAKAAWGGNYLPTPGQSENPLSRLSQAQLQQAKAEFDAELEARQTEQGVWNDLTTWYVIGRKLDEKNAGKL